MFHRYSFNFSICFLRFSPPISDFSDKISPVCLPEPGDEARIFNEAICYTTGKCSQFTYITPEVKALKNAKTNLYF